MEHLYLETNQAFSECCDVDADCVIVHDPQPLPLIEFCDRKTPWVWRCHVDLTCPDTALWDYLCRFVHKYDMCVLSNRSYVRDNLPVCQRVVHPAIDPLSPKNAEMPSEQVAATIRSLGIPMDKPVVAQVSRMDAWKDPEA
jgi:trehalose synthase